MRFGMATRNRRDQRADCFISRAAGRSYASRPRPFHCAKPPARHERPAALCGKSGGLPSAARRRRCASTSFQPSLRLRSTVSARRPQTEAKQERFDHAFVLSKLTQRIE